MTTDAPGGNVAYFEARTAHLSPVEQHRVTQEALGYLLNAASRAEIDHMLDMFKEPIARRLLIAVAPAAVKAGEEIAETMRQSWASLGLAGGGSHDHSADPHPHSFPRGPHR